MGDVEFLASGPDADGDDDVLTVEPRRNLPRWLIVLAVAVLAVGVVSAAIVTRSHRSPHHDAQPSFQPAPPPSSESPVPRGVDPNSIGPDALAIAIAGRQLYTLRPGALTAFDLTTDRELAAVSFVPVLSYTDRYYRLVYDAVEASVWVVPVGGRAPGRLMEFGAADLHPMRGIQLSTTLASAAVLDGEIYLGTADRGLLGVPPGGRATVNVQPSRDGIGPLVADPERRRLIYLTDGSPALVRSWSPAEAPRDRANAAVGRLDFSKADLVVVAGSIWAGGFRSRGAALVRLDPDTLRPAFSDDELTARLGPGAVLAAAGDRDFFVRGGADTEQLWCVDGRTGGIEQLWAGPAGAVAAGPGQVWVAGESGVGSQVLRGCVG